MNACACGSKNFSAVHVRKEDLRAFIMGEDIDVPDAWDTNVQTVNVCDDCKSVIPGQTWLTVDD